MTTIVAVVTVKDGVTKEKKIEVGEVAQAHVLRRFNPERDEAVNAKVDMTKALCAALIQQMIDLRDAPTNAAGEPTTAATKRAASIAITQLEGVQMQAVKANFVQA